MSQAGNASGSGGSTIVDTLTGNSGGAISPVAGNINTVGTGSITIAGAGNTLTTQLTGLTNHNVLVGAGTATITKVAPSATAGIPLVSNGAAADPSFTTAVVQGGGTGATSFTAHSILLGQGTSAVTALGAATNGQIPIGSTGADPVLATISAGSNISITNAAGSITIDAVSGSQVVNLTPVSTTPYVASATDYFLSVDTSVAITIQMPNAPSTGRVFVIKDATNNASVNNITVTTVGGVVLIDGSASYVMNQNYGSASFIFNGTSYEVF